MCVMMWRETVMEESALYPDRDDSLVADGPDSALCQVSLDTNPRCRVRDANETTTARSPVRHSLAHYHQSHYRLSQWRLSRDTGMFRMGRRDFPESKPRENINRQ
jgi:hypothetical protein